MFEQLNQYYPFLITAVGGIALFSRRVAEMTKLPTLLYLILMLACLQPWICINYFRHTDIWLFSVLILTIILLMVVRVAEVDSESWLKGAVSYLVGFLFLNLSLNPALGLPFPISTEWAQCFSISSAVVAFYLLFGLPPLQQGVLDIGSHRNLRLHVQANVLHKIVLSYLFISLIQGSTWIDNIMDLQNVLAVLVLLGVAVSRTILRLQTNPYRLLAYLGCGFALTPIFKLYWYEQGAMSLIIITLGFLPFLRIFNGNPPNEETDDDLFHITNFYRYHPKDASHFFKWLKIFLAVETVALLALGVHLVKLGHYGTAAAALFGALASLSVILDKKAYLPRETA